ncbi:MAG: hypothetical protein LBJ57_02065 [Prevotellaceae bacterium]|nr:hypothetical protein [Prevotellaceae bacterium]
MRGKQASGSAYRLSKRQEFLEKLLIFLEKALPFFAAAGQAGTRGDIRGGCEKSAPLCAERHG